MDILVIKKPDKNRVFFVYGGRNQNRTGLDGFAIHCITDLLSGQGCLQRAI